MITIKVRRENGKEHTFNVYKVAVTPINSLLVTMHFGINNELKMNKWAIGVGDTIFYNDTSFKINNLEDVEKFSKILIELKDKQ